MAQLELLWAAAALMLLGAIISLCVKCQLSASKREKQLGERRSQLESQPSFEVIRSHSTTTRRLEQIKEPESFLVARKVSEDLCASCHTGYGSRTEPRYQNFLTEDCLHGDAAYVEPISLDYYNCARFFTSPHEKEEDSHSYQNVVVGVPYGSDPVTDDAADYENSAAVHIWKLQQAEALQTDSPDDEPDYINAASAPLPKERESAHRVQSQERNNWGWEMPKTFSKPAVMTAPNLVESNDRSSTGTIINPPPEAINDAGKEEEGGITVLQSPGDTEFCVRSEEVLC